MLRTSRSASGNLLFFNLALLFFNLTSFSKAGDPLKLTCLPHRDAQHLWITFLQGFNLLRAFSPHGTQHCPDLSPPENAELNQYGLDLETPCLQQAGLTSVKH